MSAIKVRISKNPCRGKRRLEITADIPIEEFCFDAMLKAVLDAAEFIYCESMMIQTIGPLYVPEVEYSLLNEAELLDLYAKRLRHIESDLETGDDPFAELDTAIESLNIQKPEVQ